MSLFPKESASTVAESLGLTISDPVAAALVQDAEYRQREIIHEATKFMRHAKRTQLLPQDINYALRVKAVEPLYGYDSGYPTEFKMLASGPHVLYYVPDKELDLEELMSSELPPIPLDVTVSSHWLSIEGVQPRIIQNPTPADLADRERRWTQPRGSALQGGQDSASLLNKDGAVPLVKMVLTQELQLYFTKVTEALMSDEEELRKTGIQSIAQDPGIQGLLPYLVEFISETTAKNLKNLQVMWTMMRLIRSVLFNPDLFVEPYLHHLVPNLLTCLIAKRLGPPPNTTTSHGQPDADLRLYASHLLAHIGTTYGRAYPTLVPRITKTLLRVFLDPTKSWAARYGSILGLEGLGPQVTKRVVLPNAKSFGEELVKTSSKGLTKLTPEDQAQTKAYLTLCQKAMERLLRSLVASEIQLARSKSSGAPKSGSPVKLLTTETPSSFSASLDQVHRELGPILGLFEKACFADPQSLDLGLTPSTGTDLPSPSTFTSAPAGTETMDLS